MKVQFRNSLILLSAAVIWGLGFVAQSAGMEHVGGFTFNCLRCLMGSAVLVPCVFLLRRLQQSKRTSEESRNPHDRGTFWSRNRDLIAGGGCCGIVLCLATNLQQFAIKYTTVGKAGFITALYIVLVPVFGLLLHKKVGKLVWIGLCFSVAGLYFLCINEQFTVGAGDLLALGCAAVFSVHILVIDHFVVKVDGVAMSCLQFFVCGLISGIFMLLFEQVCWADVRSAIVPLLYSGVASCGIAYTLQIVGQKDMNPTVASMILSLESVFSVVGGWCILHQRLSPRELAGCCLMSVAVVLSQLPEKPRA